MSNITATLADVQRLFDKGKYLQALDASPELGPLTRWPAPEGRLLAGRLAGRLGAPRLGHLLKYLAYRADRDDLTTRAEWGRVKLQRGRVLSAWRLVRAFEPSADAGAMELGCWQLLHAEVLGYFRDFQAADVWLRKAHDNLPCNAEYWCLQAQISAQQDDYESAWDSAQKALAVDPLSMPAVRIAAQTLVSLGRDDEALELLTNATGKLESGELFLQLGILQNAAGNLTAARQSFAQAQAGFPLLEPEVAQMLAARRSDAAYFCGDLEEAAQFAELAGNPFHETLLPKLINSLPRRRVVLPVPFVQQHRVTCVPATLTAISNYWSMPAEQLEIAEQICYDGTPAHSERHWAECNGFFTREFRASWETTVALIDRQIPYILSTAMVGMGHAQAVIGYDTLRDTLIIRDPSQRELTEFFSESLFQDQAASGPRGMVIVPAAQRENLDGIEFLESDLYDDLYELQGVLECHDRYRAQGIVERLQATAPDHRLCLTAQSTLASYDGDPVRLLACTDRLLAMYPGNPGLVMSKLGVLGELGRHQERMAMFQEALKSIGEHPLLLRSFAGELSVDARQSEMVLELVRQILKYQPVDGQSFHLLAQQLWRKGQRPEALELYRFTACFDERNEGAAKAYFAAARALGQSDTAREFLEDRVQRFGSMSGGPAATLCWAHEQLGDLASALSVLEDAIRLQPDDSTLLIFTAQYQAWHGDFERARLLLQTARSQAHKGRWLRAAAKLAELENAPAAAIARCRELLALEPQAVDAHAMLAHHLAETEGVAAALLHLRRAVRERPRSFPLRSLLLDWIKVEGPASVQQAALEILEFQPADVGARCELSRALWYQGRVPEALAEAKMAVEFEPSNPFVHYLWGQLQLGLGKDDFAGQAFRTAICLSVDCGPAIHALVNSCRDNDWQREQLRFVHEQLKQQTILGDGLFAFRDCAHEVLDSEEVLQVLREAHHARPDLWQTWTALVRQLIAAGDLPGAQEIAEQGVQRFPLLPQMLVDLALVHRAKGNRETETELLQRAHRADRACAEACRQLAVSYRETGDLERAENILMQTAARFPEDAWVLRYWAECLWQSGAQAAAPRKMTACLRHNPADSQAWQLLATWALMANDPACAVRLAGELSAEGGLIVADELIKNEPKNVRWWREKAQFLYHLGRHDEGFGCLRHALELNPLDEETHEDFAMYLASLGRYEEALAACRPQEFGGEVPLRLRFREAEIRWHQGYRGTALVAMRGLAEQHPDYLPAWAVLTQWYASQPTSVEYFTSARELVRLQPDSSDNWCHLGVAAMNRGDRERAVSALRKAIEIDPSHLFAGWNALDLCLASRDTIAARDVVDKIIPFISNEELLAASTRIAATEDNREVAARNFRELSRLPRTDVNTLSSAANAMLENRWRSLVRQILEEEIDRQRAGPAAGHVWTVIMTEQKGWKACLRGLHLWAGHRSVWEIASCCFLEMASSANDEKRIKRFLKWERGQLRESSQTWAAVGKSLAEIGRFGEAVDWLADWKERSDTGPWMLLPLTTSMMELGRYVDGRLVSYYALGRPPDATSPLHALWVAFEEALAGDVAEAAPRLQELPVESLKESDFYAALYLLTRALLGSQSSASAAGTRPSFRSAKDEMRQALAQFPAAGKRRLPRRLYHRCLRRLAEAHDRPLLARWHGVLARR